MRKIIIFFCLKLLPGYMIGNVPEFDFRVDQIPDTLKKDANVVVRFQNQQFVIHDKASATYTVDYVVTILNKNGDHAAKLIEYYDKFIEIVSLKGTVYNGKGEEIKKMKKNDIRDYSAVSGFSIFDDNRVKYYDPLVKHYPYTIHYQYEFKFKGLLFLPKWIPQDSYNVSVEKSSFALIFPEDMSPRYKLVNIDKEPINSLENGNRVLRWELMNLVALDQEPLSPNFSEIVPIVYFAPDEFEMDGYEGNIESWQNFGQWIYNLNKGKTYLPEETVATLKELTADLKTPVEKVQKVYEYLQERTRYVSIQLGIGGWEPFPAETVDRLGYGDCKALSNYTMAMLESIGINSYYTLVRAGRRESDVFEDFPSQHFNHAILTVPLQEDTIWLECTSQKNPFGFIGNFTDDRHVLMIDETGGKLIKTRAYHGEENVQVNVTHVTIDENGYGTAAVSQSCKGLQYDNLEDLIDLSKEDQKKKLYKFLRLSNYKIQDFTITAKKNLLPEVKLAMELSLEPCASTVGSRMMFPGNLLNKKSYVPKKLNERKTDIYQRFEYEDRDSIMYILPQGYSIEFLPQAVDLSTEFGTYNATYEIKEPDQIIYTRQVRMYKKKYPPEMYEKLIDFYMKMVKSDGSKVVLKKS